MAKFDICVVGAGIAGLAISEIFARSGLSVCLIDKNKYICNETSGLHHEWFHFGSLYSFFPSSQYLRTMAGGVDDLLHYYRDFSGMNLRIDENGKLLTVNKKNAWLRDDIIKYYVAKTSNQDFHEETHHSLKKKIERTFFKFTWDKAIKKSVSRHNRYFGYDWRRGEASHNIAKLSWSDYDEGIINNVTYNKNILIDPETHFYINSLDRPMSAENIISDLIKSYISYQGQLYLNNEVISYYKDKHCYAVQLKNKDIIHSDKVIFASADGTSNLTSKVDTKKVVSPLLVTYPHVCSENFVRITPFIDKTVNHIIHKTSNTKYSLIGGGYYANINDKSSINLMKKDLFKQAQKFLPKVKSAQFTKIYLGTKTEFTGLKTKRNYMYSINEIDEGAYIAIPGKFSLSFSLAVNTYKKIIGHYPNTFTSYNKDIDHTKYFKYSGHRKIINEIKP